MLANIFADTVNVLRRTSTPSVDVLNNPNYGDPTTWNKVYSNIKVRLAYSGKMMTIKNTGEMIYPQGTGYAAKNIALQPMDRIVIVNSPGVPKGIEYFVEAVYPSYIMNGVVDHVEFAFHLPV